MSLQAVRKFLGDTASQPELRKRLDSALAAGGDQQTALIAFAASEGYNFEASELIATARDRELSDGALDKVAGGIGAETEELQQAEVPTRLGNFEIQRLLQEKQGR